MAHDDNMKAAHHDLDIKPVPEQVLYINEPDITGMFCGLGTIYLPNGIGCLRKIMNAEQSPDHVRVYVPAGLEQGLHSGILQGGSGLLWARR